MFIRQCSHIISPWSEVKTTIVSLVKSFSSKKARILPRLSSMQRTIPKYLDKVLWLSFFTALEAPLPARAVLQSGQHLTHSHRLLEGQVIVHRHRVRISCSVREDRARQASGRRAFSCRVREPPGNDRPTSRWQNSFIRPTQIVDRLSILLGCNRGPSSVISNSFQCPRLNMNRLSENPNFRAGAHPGLASPSKCHFPK